LDWFNYLKTVLRDFEGIFQRKYGAHSDGLATLFNTSKFKLASPDRPFDFVDVRHSPNNDDVATIVHLFMLGPQMPG